MNKTDVIIVHFGDINTTLGAISSLKKHTTYRNIIVVNNDKRIKVEDYIKSRNVISVNSEKNLGFAAGVNRGIKIAIEKNAEYIVLLNNDAKAEDDFISTLSRSFSTAEKAGIIAPVIKFKQNGQALYDTGGVIQNKTGKTYHNNYTKIPKIKLISAEYVSGCCMMIRADVIKKIGYFDEQFFLYYEDVDFCLRANKVGYEIYCSTDAIVSHDLSKTVGKDSRTALYYLVQSGRKFGAKYRKKFPLHTLFMVYQSGIFFLRSPLALGSIVKGWV